MNPSTLDTPKTGKRGRPRNLLWPPLETGYHLSRAEFERRYEMMPEVKKAELIEGVVIMGSPVSYPHATATGAIATWLGAYTAATPGVGFAENASVVLDADNEVQPDALLRLETSSGGQSRLDQRAYVMGAPELIIEVAKSSLAYDLHEKLRIYRRNRVLEYAIWQLENKRLDWFAWQKGEYVPLAPQSGGLLCSRVFPGLWLHRSALLAGNLKRVLVQAQRGIGCAEHRRFVKHLAGGKGIK